MNEALEQIKVQSGRRSFILLVSIMIGLSLISAAIMTFILYRHELEQQKTQLVATVQSQARLIEAIAKSDSRTAELILKGDSNYRANEETLRQIKEAHEQYEQGSQATEFTIARRDGDNIVFLIRHRHGVSDLPKPISFKSTWAEPQRLALQGKSGTIVGLDYRGETVLAAYEPVEYLDIGIVAKLDLAEIRAPFIQAVLIGGLSIFILIFIGTLVFFRISKPVVEQLEHHNKALLAEIDLRLQSEKELRNQANFLDVVVENSPFAMWVSDAKGVLIRANQALRSILNLTDDMIVGKYNVLHDENLDAQDLMPVVEAVFNDLKPTRFTMYWTSTKASDFNYSSTTELWLDVSLFPITDEVGKLVNVVCQYVDISDRKLAEELLTNERQQAQQYLDIAGVMFVALDENGSITLINQKGCDILGYSEAEILNKNWFDLCIPEENREEIRGVFKQLLSGEIDLVEYYENSVLTKTGEQKIVAFHNALIRDKKSNITGTLGSGEDITKRKRAEDDLRSSASFYKTILNNLSEGLVVHNQTENIILANNAAASVLRQSMDQLLGKDSRDPRWQALHDDGTPFLYEEHPSSITLHSGESVKNAIMNIHTGDDDRTFISINSNPIRDDSGNVVNAVVTFNDITERKLAEQERLILEAQLRQSQKLEAIGTLAGGVAHEINNPLTGILNYAQLIKERLDPTSPLREFAEGISQETERVAEITKNLLSFARQDKQSHSPALISDIVNNTVSLIGTIIRKDQITLEVDIPDGLPQLKCRSQQIQQIIMNLLTNARDALNGRYQDYDEDKLIMVSVKQFEKEGRRWLRTTVEDHGSGIPDEIKERIFDPFYTTKDRAEGTGLGLSISLGIAQDHHGSISFDTTPNKYTRFYLDLPVDNGWDLEEKK